jgi:hypothetical protein
VDETAIIVETGGMASWFEMVAQMKARGIAFDRGLTDAEIAATEAKFGFCFPADLRAFLQAGLPKGRGFPDWRGDEARLREQLAIPLEGILFDIEHNNFWLEEWGAPRSLDEAKRIARDLIAAAPKLIPIFMHRMMPDEPGETGNPVLSVHQTDIIYYGFDLLDYFRHDFKLGDREPWPEKVRPIRFWDLARFQSRWNQRSTTFDNTKRIP